MYAAYYENIKKNSRKNLARRGIAPTNLNNRIRKIAQSVVNKNSETHHFGHYTAEATISNAGSIDCISDVPQGDTDVTREGDSLIPLSATVSFHCIGHSTAYTRLRLMIFRWKRDDNVEPPTAVSQILENTSDTDQLMASIYNWDDRKDFDVLYDRVLCIAPSGATGGGDKYQYQIKKNIKLNNKKYTKRIQYDNTATTGQGNIYFLMVSDQATNKPSAYLYSQFYFKP